MIRVVSHGPLPMVWCRLPEWRVLVVSGRFTETFGYDTQDIPDVQAWFKLAYPDETYRSELLKRWTDYLDANATSGSLVPDIEVRATSKRGNEIRCVVSTAILDGHALVSMYDITQLRQALNRLDESENRYHLLFANMTSGFALHQMIYDEQGKPFDYRYLEVNPAFERLTHIPATAILGHTLRELMPNTEQYWINNFAHVAETGEAIAYMNYAQEINRWFDTYAFCPRPGMFAVVFNDVTDRVVAENALRDLNAQLEQRINERTAELERSTRQLMQSEKLAGLGTLVAGVAHEVNTPIGIALTAVSFLDDLLRRAQPRADNFERRLADGLDITLRNLTRAADIIRSFKQFSVDQSSGQERSFGLDELCHDVVTSLSPRLRRCGIVVEQEIPTTIRLAGPAGDLSQVLTNLIINALEHGFQGITDEGRITIAGKLQETQLELTIANNGAAIPTEIQHRVFDPFFTTRRGEGGTGLGLSIVHSIVTERCSGRISFDSSPGKGVSFRISLPVGPGNSFSLS